MRKKNRETFNYESMHKREGVNWYERRHDYVVDYSAVRGMLKSAVGRPWNKVWSEICHKFDPRTLRGKESRDYARSLVELEPEVDEHGEVLIRRYWYRDNFYVHPITGILKSVPKTRYVPKKVPLDEQLITLGKRSFFKHEGIWYEVLFKDLPPKKKDDTVENRIKGKHSHYSVNDVFEATHKRGPYFWGFSSYWTFENHYVKLYGRPVYCYAKQQIGKRDIKRIKDYIIKHEGKD